MRGVAGGWSLRRGGGERERRGGRSRSRSGSSSSGPGSRAPERPLPRRAPRSPPTSAGSSGGALAARLDAAAVMGAEAEVRMPPVAGGGPPPPRAGVSCHRRGRERRDADRSSGRPRGVRGGSAVAAAAPERLPERVVRVVVVIGCGRRGSEGTREVGVDASSRFDLKGRRGAERGGRTLDVEAGVAATVDRDDRRGDVRVGVGLTIVPSSGGTARGELSASATTIFPRRRGDDGPGRELERARLFLRRGDSGLNRRSIDRMGIQSRRENSPFLGFARSAYNFSRRPARARPSFDSATDA